MTARQADGSPPSSSWLRVRGFLPKVVKSKNPKIDIVARYLRIGCCTVFKINQIEKFYQVFRYGGLKIGSFYQNK